MNTLLTGLGVPPEVQAFFNAGELLFHYGGDVEVFGPDFHLVPTTRHLYIAGNDAAKELVLTSSVMEGIAFLTFNAHHYPNLDNLSVIALGNLPQRCQFDDISAGRQKRKVRLVFGNDILGRLTDIRTAAGLRCKMVSLSPIEDMINIEYNLTHYRFEADNLTLNKFEKAVGIRSGIRTSKPKQFNTYLDQLKYDTNQ